MSDFSQTDAYGDRIDQLNAIAENSTHGYDRIEESHKLIFNWINDGSICLAEFIDLSSYAL